MTLYRLLYAAILAAAIPILAWNGFVQQLGAQWTDILIRLRRPADTAGVREVVLVAIDDATASRYGPLPLRRSILAAGLDRLAQYHPKVLALDLLISEPGDPAGDRALAEAVGRFPRAVVSAALDSGAPDERWILPLPELAAHAATARVHAAQDPDGIVRSVLLEKAAQGRRYWALALQSARLAIGAGTPVERRSRVAIDSTEIPSRAMLINFAGPEGAYRRVPFSILLDGAPQPEIFRGKIVIVGVTAQGSGDRLFTPVSSHFGMSGIEIHANAIRTIRDGVFVEPLGPQANTPPARASRLSASCWPARFAESGWRWALQASR